MSFNRYYFPQSTHTYTNITTISLFLFYIPIHSVLLAYEMNPFFGWTSKTQVIVLMYVLSCIYASYYTIWCSLNFSRRFNLVFRPQGVNALVVCGACVFLYMILKVIQPSSTGINILCKLIIQIGNFTGSYVLKLYDMKYI